MRAAALLLALFLVAPAAAQEGPKRERKPSLLDKLKGDLKDLDRKERKVTLDPRIREPAARVAALRGLLFVRPVPLRGPAPEREYPAAQLERLGATLRAFGLASGRVDLAKRLRRADRLAACLYPDERGALPLTKRPADRRLHHGLTHALEDQLFGFAGLRRRATDGDAGLALRCLIEGSAGLVELQLATEGAPAVLRDPAVALTAGSLGLRALSPTADPLDRYLAALAIAPRRDGLRLVHALHKEGGWAAVDRAYRTPPRTTEQVLHPDKFLGAELPRPVTLPDVAAALGQGHAPLATDSLGELRIRLLLHHRLGGSVVSEDLLGAMKRLRKGRLLGGLYDRTVRRVSAVEMAAGWAGDRYRVYRAARGLPVLVWRTLWDSDTDAEEFARGWARVLARGRLSWRRWQVTRKGRTSAVRRQGKRVDVLLHVPKERWQAVLRALR